MPKGIPSVSVVHTNKTGSRVSTSSVAEQSCKFHNIYSYTVCLVGRTLIKWKYFYIQVGVLW